MAKMTYDEKVDKLFELMQDDEEEWKRMKEEYEEYGIEDPEMKPSAWDADDEQFYKEQWVSELYPRIQEIDEDDIDSYLEKYGVNVNGKNGNGNGKRKEKKPKGVKLM